MPRPSACPRPKSHTAEDEFVYVIEGEFGPFGWLGQLGSPGHFESKSEAALSLDARTRRGVPISMCVHRDSVSHMPYHRRGDWIKIRAAARAAGLSDYIVFSRLRSGWTLEKALNTPVRTVRTRAHKRSSGSRFDARGV
jgi:hypothetical protein